MNKIKNKILHKLQEFQSESQTWPLQKASVLVKILALIYLLIGRKTIAKSMVSSSQCNACNRCVQICPNNAIKLKKNNPRRNNRCKGCFLCVYSCPRKVFELPISSLIGACLLLFLPYDEWIIKIFSLNIVPDIASIKYQFISLILWCIGFAIVVFVFEKIIFLFSIFPIFKKFGENRIIKKMRDKINPTLIFPAIIPKNPTNLQK